MIQSFLLEFLSEKNIAFEELSPEDSQNYPDEWVNRFVPPEKVFWRKHCVSRDISVQYLWHIFMGSEGLESFEGDLADKAFDAQDKGACILLDNTNHIAIYVRDASGISSADLHHMCDVTVTDVGFNWTYSKDHEEYGPFFHDRRVHGYKEAPDGDRVWMWR